jgi:lipoprotein-anchoring transpeptidase ErfK/SrfK
MVGSRSDLATQLLRAFQDNKAVLTFHSHQYDVDMNYAMFFTHDGKAIHQYHGLAPLSLIRTVKTGLTDLVGSHGCVRLGEQDAHALYDWAPLGTLVHIKK